MHRRVEDRANSAVSRFGAKNQEVLLAFSRGEGMDSWEAQGLTEESLQIIRRYDYTELNPQSAAAMFWYIRNQLFFDQCLNDRDDVLLVSYEELVSEPAFVMPVICSFLDCSYSPVMIQGIHSHSVGKAENWVESSIQNLCEGMQQRLDAARKQQWDALLAGRAALQHSH